MDSCADTVDSVMAGLVAGKMPPQSSVANGTGENRGEEVPEATCLRCGGFHGLVAPATRYCSKCVAKYNDLVDPRFRGVTFAKLTETDGNRTAIAAVQEWSTYPANNKCGVLLTGPCGCGKTALAFAAVGMMWRKKHRVEVASMQRLVREFEQSFKYRDSETVIEKYMATTLVLDDLAAINATPNTMALMQELIDERYRRGLDRILVTTDLSVDDAARMAPRVVSRLMEQCRAYRITGTDWRREAAKKAMEDTK